MEKFRYGTKETIATLIGLACFVLAEWLQMKLAGRGVIPPNVYSWVQLRVLVIAIVAVFFGPLCGVFTGLGGDLLINVIFESRISYPEVIVLGVYGLFMGLYYGRIHFNRKGFTARDFVDFNAIQIFAGLLCSLFMVPILLHFLEDVDVIKGVMIGAKSAFGNSVAVGTVVPIIMICYNYAMHRGRKGIEQNSGTDTML